MGCYCSYLLPKQIGGTTQILVFKTLRMTEPPTVYICHDPTFALTGDLVPQDIDLVDWAKFLEQDLQ